MSAITFEYVASDCCALCNPVGLVDFEGPCVAVRVPVLEKSIVICESCAVSMVGVLGRKRPKSVDYHPEVERVLDAVQFGIHIGRGGVTNRPCKSGGLTCVMGPDGKCKTCGFVFIS